MTKQSIALRIFDQTITVKTHSTELHTIFEEMYRRFLYNDDAQLLANASSIIVEQLQDEQGPTAESYSVFDVSRLLRTYVTQIRTHLLIHAGVLSYADQGILIVAPSMHGKTTLTLKLLHDGFDFLSDDIAPLGLNDGLVYPFPRAFVIRQGSLKLAGFPPLPPDTPTWLGKQIIDAETLRPKSIGKPVPIRHIFFLHDPTQDLITDNAAPLDGKLTSELDPKFCMILLTSLPQELESSIRSIDGLQIVSTEQSEGRVLIGLSVQNRLLALQQIDTLCQAHDVDIIHLDNRMLNRPRFDNPVALSNLSHSDAVIQLLQQFLGGYHSLLFQEELGNSPIRLSMTIARMIKEAECYQLSVGPLHEMAEIVCQTVGFQPKQ